MKTIWKIRGRDANGDRYAETTESKEAVITHLRRMIYANNIYVSATLTEKIPEEFN